MIACIQSIILRWIYDSDMHHFISITPFSRTVWLADDNEGFGRNFPHSLSMWSPYERLGVVKEKEQKLK